MILSRCCLARCCEALNGSSPKGKLSETQVSARLFPEDESNAADGMDQGWSIVQFDFLTQIADVDIEEVVVSIKVFSPDPMHDLLTFQHPAGTSHQEIEQVVFLHGQFDGSISTFHIPGPGVHGEVGDLENFVDVGSIGRP